MAIAFKTKSPDELALEAARRAKALADGAAQPSTAVSPAQAATSVKASNPLAGVGDVLAKAGAAATGAATASAGADQAAKAATTQTAPAQVPATTPPGGAPATVTPRALSPRAQSLLDQIEARLNAAPMTSDQIMQSPEYQAQQRVIQFNRDQAQAASRRALASRNMLRSTPAIQTLESSNAYYTAQEDALVPQLVNVAYNRQQQELQNLRSALGDALAADSQSFNQGLADFNAGLSQAGVTGTYQGAPTLAGRQTVANITGVDPVSGRPTYDAGLKLGEYTGVYKPPGAQVLIDEALAAKEEYARAADDVSRQRANAKAVAARAKLMAMGITNVDELIGAGVTLDQARANAGKVGLVKPVDPNTDAKAKAEVELAQLRAEEQRLKNQLAADPNSGMAAKQRADLEAVQALIRQREASATASYASASKSSQPTAGAQRNELRGLISQGKTQGRTYEETVAAIRENAGDLGDVSLQDALQDAADIYGVQKPSATDARNDALNSFASDALTLKSRGRSYEQAVSALSNMVQAGQLNGLTYYQALDTIDRVYGQGRYAQ